MHRYYFRKILSPWSPNSEIRSSMTTLNRIRVCIEYKWRTTVNGVSGREDLVPEIGGTIGVCIKFVPSGIKVLMMPFGSIRGPPPMKSSFSNRKVDKPKSLSSKVCKISPVNSGTASSSISFLFS